MKKKKIIIIVLLIIIGVWVKSRWRAWFISLPESEYTIAISPDRITLLPGEDFNTTRIVTWRCDSTLTSHSSDTNTNGNKNSYAILINGNDTLKVKASNSLAITTGGKDAFHKVKFDNLKCDSTYHYKVVTGNKESEWHTFKMPKNTKIKKLVYIGDIQDTIGGLSNKIISSIFHREKDVDAVIFGGDLIEGPVDKYWDYSYQYLDSIAQSIPIIAIAGNHEYRKGLPPYLDQRWKHTFAYDQNGASGCDASYFTKSDNMLILTIDTQIFSRAYTIFTQYNWIKETIAKYGEDRIKILVMHHPIYSVKKGRYNIVEKEIFRPLLEDLGFDIILAGHEHGYGRFINASGKSRPLYIVSHCSPKTYNLEESNDSRIIIGDIRTYQTFDFSGKTIKFLSKNAESGEIIDNFEL